MVHHGLPQRLIFLPVFQQLVCYQLIVQCSPSHFRYIGVSFSTSIFTDPWSLSLIRFLPFVPFILHIYVLNRTQFIPLQIPPYNALPFIYFASINPIISVHMYFLQHSVHRIISYSISYNSFHILFHWGVSYVCIFTYLFPFSFLTMHIIVFFYVGLKSLTCYIQPYFNTFRLLFHLSHQFTILSITVSVFGNSQPVRSSLMFTYKTFVQLVYSHRQFMF